MRCVGWQERAQVLQLCTAVQEAAGQSVEVAWADQDYTSKDAKSQAAEQGIDLQIFKLPEAKKGFVLLPRRWIVERSFGWLARFRLMVAATNAEQSRTSVGDGAESTESTPWH